MAFSIGFEKIFKILKDKREVAPNNRQKIAIFYENDYIEANKRADSLRASYDVALFEKPKKLNKFLSSLKDNDFYGFIMNGKSDDIKPLN